MNIVAVVERRGLEKGPISPHSPHYVHWRELTADRKQSVLLAVPAVYQGIETFLMAFMHVPNG
jgi:hypothetical protein